MGGLCGDWILPGCQEQRRPGRKLFILVRYHGTQTTATQDHSTLVCQKTLHVYTLALLCLLSFSLVIEFRVAIHSKLMNITPGHLGNAVDISG